MDRHLGLEARDLQVTPKSKKMNLSFGFQVLVAVSADRPVLPVPREVAGVLADRHGEDLGDRPGDTAGQGDSEAVVAVEAGPHPLMLVRFFT